MVEDASDEIDEISDVSTDLGDLTDILDDEWMSGDEFDGLRDLEMVRMKRKARRCIQIPSDMLSSPITMRKNRTEVQLYDLGATR